MSTMPPAFDYSQQFDDPVREDLAIGHRRAWERLSLPGTSWTGRERVAIATETRAASTCSFCQKRREALSPFSVQGDHDDSTRDILPAAAIDVVHRIVTDPGRLIEDWIIGLTNEGEPAPDRTDCSYRVALGGTSSEIEGRSFDEEVSRPGARARLLREGPTRF